MKRKTKNKDKLRVWTVGIVALLVIATFILFSVTVISLGNIFLGIGSIIIALLILIFAAILLKKQYSAVSKGFPYEDERSRKIMTIAGYYAFLISIWYLLVLSWVADEWSIIQFRDVSQALGAGILGMAIIFGICWVITNMKER